MKLRAPSRKAVTLAPVLPNAGTEAMYRRKLIDLIDAMHKSIMFHVRADWKKAGLATDAAPEKELEGAMKKLGKQWDSTFKAQSKTIAKKFQDEAFSSHDTAFKHSLRKAGVSVRMQTSPDIEDALDYGIAENADLITSIPMEYMEHVVSQIRDSVSKGRSLSKLTEDLESIHGMTRRRAALIARDQNNKATAIIHRIRQKQVGIKKAKWIHTSASIHPREEHLAWDGQTYDIETGMYSDVDGEFVWPGTPINCGCTSMSIVPGSDEDEDDEDEEEA